MTPEKEARLLEISKQTLEEVRARFANGYTRVLAVRPTGFGKSYMLANLTSTMDNGEYRYKKCLYVYPTDVIKEDVIRTYASDKKFLPACVKYEIKNRKRNPDERAGMLNDNTDFLSYKWFTGRADDIKSKSGREWTKAKLRDMIKEYDLIMLDECHRVGAPGFQAAYEYIKSLISINTHLIGVTATPYRYDEESIKGIFGERNEISKYTLEDAIKEGLLNRFDYIYAVNDNQEYIDSAVATIDRLRDILGTGRCSLPDIEELEQFMHQHNMANILREKLQLPLAYGGYEEHVGNNNYAKFIIFMNNRAQIHEQASRVEGWFKQAYPTMNIDSHVIITKDKEDTPYIINGKEVAIVDTDELSEYEIVDNKIDLIFCVDKLNMGYHVESITGVILIGNTESAVKYNQRIGRCFSVRSDNKPIIFDIINKFEMSPAVQLWPEYKRVYKNKGQRIDLPNLLSKKCVDSYDYTKEFADFARKMVEQKFEKQEVITWLYINRSMPVPIIAQALGIKLDIVLRVLFNSKIKIEDKEEVLKHKDLITDEVLKRLEAK